MARQVRLTIHSSRSRFAARLNSGVRLHMQPFVDAILPQHVSVTNPPAGLVSEFPELVMAGDQAKARLHYSGQEELAVLLTRLQLLAIPFVAAGPGWHPAAVFQHLRSRHLVTGTIPTIVWLGPGRIELGEV
jgi:hypothetical protein